MFKKLFKFVGYSFLLLVGLGVFVEIFGEKKPSDAPVSQPAQKSAAADSASPKPQAAAPAQAEVDWNVKDLDALTNGNIRLAVKLLKSKESIPKNSQAEATSVLKAPWKYYGQMLCFSGTIGVVEDHPPGSDTSKALGGGETSEVVIETGDGSIVDLLAMKSSGTLKVQEQATVCGLPVGRVEVKNALGGNFTHLILVGQIK